LTNKFKITVLSILIVLSITACSASSAAAPAKTEKISATIGVFIGLSGDVLAYGDSQKKGIDLASKEITDSAYLGSGNELKIIMIDAGPSPDSAITAITKLINDDKVSGLIGPTLSSQAFKADPIAQKAGIPVIAISNTAPGITEMGDYIFRCSLPESEVIEGTMKAAASQLRVAKVAYLWGKDDDYTVAGYKAFTGAVTKNGLRVAADMTFSRGDSSFKEQLKEIIIAKPDAILVSALAKEAIVIISQARELGYQGLIVGGNGFNSPDLIKQAGKAAEGIMAGTAWNIAGTNPRNLEFISNYQKAYNIKPDQFAAQAYTGLWLFANAVRSSGSTNPKAIRDALASINNFTTPLGSFSFTANREPLHPSIVQIVRNGRFTVFNP
jgi:branched-chain amino acid transport system substrate-binding protein